MMLASTEQPQLDPQLREQTLLPQLYSNRRWIKTRQAIRLGEEGLTEVYGGREVTTPWDEVYGVEWHAYHAKIKLAGRALAVDDRYGDWRRLAQQVEELSPAATGEARGMEVDPEQIAEWLGIPVDGSLVCRLGMPRWGAWALLSFIILMFVLMLVFAHGNGFGGFVQVPMIVGALLLSAEKVTADVNGVSVRMKGRPQRFAWSEIVSVTNHGQYWEVVTDRGKFRVAGSVKNAAKLVNALQHAAASRGVGMVLPDEAPLPEGAISRMTGPTEGDVQRGISRAE
ncbi:MAG: hypothetical protein HYU66_05220 [Armatimonadetes bacterium]|nr:hypothetical protein [Armatimonadota bacterium]